MSATDRIALTALEKELLIAKLEERFQSNRNRHPALEWGRILPKLEEKGQKLWSLHQMEQTGGEPDVVGYDPEKDVYLFMDCSPESPVGRRSLCYDQEALNARKENKPKNAAVAMASFMGVELLTEEQYRALQGLGNFDRKTSSWVATPVKIRSLGGAIFCDRRYDTVFTYHNGAESYYAARGFRGCLRV